MSVLSAARSAHPSHIRRVICGMSGVSSHGMTLRPWRAGGAEAGREGLAAGPHHEQRLIAHAPNAVHDGGRGGGLRRGGDSLSWQPLHRGRARWAAAAAPAGQLPGSPCDPVGLSFGMQAGDLVLNQWPLVWGADETFARCSSTQRKKWRCLY